MEKLFGFTSCLPLHRQCRDRTLTMLPNRLKTGVMVLALASSTLFSQTTTPKPGPPVIFSVATRDFTVEFAGERAWTFYRILHKGEIITDKVGFYGTVFSAEGGKWIGTGHTDGGVEKIESVELRVDGKNCDLANKAAYHGSRAALHKHSMMGPIKLEATYVVTDDAILEHHRYEATEEVKIGTLYAFMHPWLPRTTEWIAEKTDGSIVEGSFNTAKDFKLHDDVRWTAIYDPVGKRAMLAWYPTPLVGQGIKTGYWDQTAYHKLYNQIYSHATVPAGAKFEAAVIIRAVETDASGWKEVAKKLAEETKTLEAAGKFGTW
jgi:hypothetical protein